MKPSTSRPVRGLALGLALSAAVTHAALAQADPAGPPAAATARIPVGEVLQLGPLPLPLPAFGGAERHGLTLEQLLDARSLDVALLRPRSGQTLALAGGASGVWTEAALPGSWQAPSGSPAEVWLAFDVRSDRWRRAELELAAPDGVHLQAWLAGEPLELAAAEDAANGSGAAAGVVRRTAELKLPDGVGLVVLRSVVPADHQGPWELAVALLAGEGEVAGILRTATDGRRPADIRLILDAPRVQEALIAPDGTLAALLLGANDPDGERRRWLEVRRVPDGELVAARDVQDIGGLQWAPTGRGLSFTRTDDGQADLWLWDLDGAGLHRLLRGVKDLRSYRWAPDGSFVVYAVQEEAEPDERRVKRVEGPADRQPWWRHRTHLAMAGVPHGTVRRLTAGPLNPTNWSLGPDGDRLLFFLEDQDLAGGRPYFSSELWELDLATLQAERLLADRWIGAAAYGPDRDLLLLQGSPSAFDGLGRDLPAGVPANDYGGELYLFDRRTGEASPLTRDLDPAVGRAWWSLDDGLVYADCTDGQRRRVWRADPRRGRWELVEGGLEYVDQFDPARRGRRALVRGTGATTPNRVFSVDLHRNRSRLLHDPGQEAWRDVAFGEVEHWRAPLPDGEMLDGRIYWPVDFDPSRRYPVIVYYYGGTSPVTVDFGGRYPKNVWSGQGYIVYVPQPSGAIGYGQEFAARHVNDWGRRTAWEVTEATRAFLARHADVADPERVGCIGASYGGFLTMYLISQTDLFAAAVSHAGISSIASYWGEGLWGYVYGARALAGAFPWSDRDLYVEQSALFHADRITTPLLLVHGDSDTNVPVGESDQLFTALKLLGREVEYVQIVGQDHHILDRAQRIVWNDTILAFFARWLKDQPQWWEDLYPAR